QRYWLVLAAGFVFMFGAPLAAHGELASSEYEISEEDLAKIEAALPDAAPATPAEPRKLLVFDVNRNYGGHPSRFHANKAFERMGEATGAFETVVSRNPEVFERDSLEEFDAVFFNNTVGNLFEDEDLRQNLIDFVYSGGGLMGCHGTTVAFTRWGEDGGDDWPEFGVMLGGRGAAHRESDEHAYMKLDSPEHPLNAPFSEDGFDFRDEFFRVQDPYSRDRVRVLFSMDVERTDLEDPARERADRDYAQAWVRNYGRGRVFHCTIGHNPYVFWDPQMLEFYLGATQFALGDLDAPTTPSARLTPAIQAQEDLGWRVGLDIPGVDRTLFETIQRAGDAGVLYMTASNTQLVSGAIDKPFGPGLDRSEREAIRLQLDGAGVRLLGYRLDSLPGSVEETQGAFAFARRMGMETVLAEAPKGTLDLVEDIATTHDMEFALLPGNATPQALKERMEGRDDLLGVHLDAPAWSESGIDPVEGLMTLGERVTTVRLDDKTGENVLRAIHQEGLHPTIIGYPQSQESADQTAVSLQAALAPRFRANTHSHPGAPLAPLLAMQ
ncbi:MAG: ThuA domain-containing protein, partial [Candidatus Hydrogenedentota bacterium]